MFHFHRWIIFTMQCSLKAGANRDNILGNMLARFAIAANMLAKKKNPKKCWPTLLVNSACCLDLLCLTTCWPTLWATIWKFERFFENFYYEIIISNVFRTREINKTELKESEKEFTSMLAKMLACCFYGVSKSYQQVARNVGENVGQHVGSICARLKWSR